MPESRERSRLRLELARVRDKAGLSTRRLGAELGVTYGTITRDENGPTLPPLPRVRRWLDVCNVVGEDRDRILDLAERARSETRSWGELLAAPENPQDQFRRLERAATLVRVWQPTVVPGVLQVGEYAAAVLDAGWTVDVEKAMVARQRRQHDLRSSATSWQFLITEQVWRAGWAPPSVAAAQRERVRELAGLDAVSVGVVPDAVLTVPAWHNFTLLTDEGGDVTVSRELVEGLSTLGDEEDVERYEILWARLTAAATAPTAGGS